MVLRLRYLFSERQAQKRIRLCDPAVAEAAVARIRVAEKENNHDLETRVFPLLSKVVEKRLVRIENRHEQTRAEKIFRVWQSELNKDFPVNELTAAVTKMLQAGVDLSTVGSITGHSD